MKLFAAAALATLTLPALVSSAQAPQQPITWRFDNLTKIGDTQVTPVGKPTIVDTPIGKAVHFEGRGKGNDGGNNDGDALFLNEAPLAGFATYTFEVIFRPSSKGAQAQRFFHLQENDTESRRMFEIRIMDKQWCLDTVAIDAGGSPGARAVTLVCDAAHLHPLDRWYAVTATWDGKTLRGYVDGQLQGEVAASVKILGEGITSVGTRIDKRDFFTGEVYSARFTPRVLAPADFLKVPEPARH